MNREELQRRAKGVSMIESARQAGLSDDDIATGIIRDNPKRLGPEVAKALSSGISSSAVVDGILKQNSLDEREKLQLAGEAYGGEKRFERTGKAEPSVVGGALRDTVKALHRFGSTVGSVIDPTLKQGTDLGGVGVSTQLATRFNPETQTVDKLSGGEAVKDVAGNVLELASLVPIGGAATTAGKAAVGQFGKQAVKTAAREGAIGGLLGASGQALQGGSSIGEAIGRGVAGAATGAVISPVATAGAGIAGRLFRSPVESTVGTAANKLEAAAERVQKNIIRPLKSEIDAGFKDSNLSKYNIYGGLREVLEKTNSEIKTRASQLDSLIKDMGGKKVDTLGDIFDDLEVQTTQNTVFGGTAIKSKLKNLEADLALAYGENWRDVGLDFGELIALKRSAGVEAAFHHDPLKKNTETIGEKVFNKLYRVIKKRTEELAGGTEFEQLNKELSELIPIERAIIRRIPVAERNNVISLTDFLSLQAGVAVNPAALGVGAIHKFLRSGYGAKTLSGAGKVAGSVRDRLQSVINK